jgi:hypothetical protein
MMSRNYIAAASAGMFIGCLVLVSWGLFGFHTGDWRIPNLDQLHFADKAVLQVRMLAYARFSANPVSHL